MTELINQARSRIWKHQLFWFVCLMIFLLCIESCSPKPEPAPTPKSKLKKPDWVNGKDKDSDNWFGVGSVALGDSIDPKSLATKAIQKQVHSQIKKSIKNEFDINNTILERICDQALISRTQVIDSMIKKEDSYNDGTRRYILLSLNKNNYSETLKKRLDDLDIEETLSKVQGPPDKEIFLSLSKVLKTMVEFIDFIVDRGSQTSRDYNILFNKVRSILNVYNDRIFFSYNPASLNSIPMSNDQKELTISVIDGENKKKLDSIYVQMDYSIEHAAETWVSDSSKDYTLFLPNAGSKSVYVLTISIDYQKMLRGNYLDLLSVKPKHSKVTVIPQNIKVYSTESIASLGTGLEYSAVYDSIKSCFGNNYSAEFVRDINDSDVLMNIEVSTKENMRRQSRKDPFKSEAFFILRLEDRETGNNIFSHMIAKTEAVDYDFVERASVRALRDLSNKASQSICK